MLVLGAGASLAEAVNRRPTRDRDHPPLDATFFRRAQRHGNTALLRRVVKQARLLGEPDLLAADPAVSLEAYLGRLYFEINHNPLKASAGAYFDAVDLYAREITATTNWLMGKKGLIRKLIQAELRAGRDVTVVTFNIDLLAENAVDSLRGARPGVEWSLNHAYGFATPKEVLVASGTASRGEFDRAGARADIVIFKMHGSVNWVFRHRDAHPPADLVSKEREFYVLTNKQLPQVQLQVRTKRGGRPWYLSPLLVPPVYEKHGLIKRHLQDVWDGASNALLAADRVVFWGYSFPLADTHARHYFQGIAQQNDALKRPVLINPDPGAETALWQVLRPDGVEHFRGADGYIESLDGAS